jgi:hypothetical protein
MNSTPDARLPRIRWRALLIGLIVGFALISLAAVHVASGLHDFSNDFGTYFDAGTRIRQGGQLYLPPLDGDPDGLMYKYAPWFAWLWAPVSLLPRQAAALGWSALMAVASVWALVPILRRPSWAGAAVVGFFGPLLFYTSMTGNVQPLLTGLLLHTVEHRRLGPVAIALAASLKAFPALFAIVYLCRRQWGRFALAAGLTIVLTTPMLLYDLSDYVVAPGFSITPSHWAPGFYVLLAASALVAAALFASTRFRWLAAAAAVSMSMTRLLWYDLTFLLVGFAPLTAEPFGSRQPLVPLTACNEPTSLRPNRLRGRPEHR